VHTCESEYLRAELSLEGYGAWSEAVYVGPSLSFVHLHRGIKPVTCKFNITGTKLCMY
jgi:hypothetical protein